MHLRDVMVERHLFILYLTAPSRALSSPNRAASGLQNGAGTQAAATDDCNVRVTRRDQATLRSLIKIDKLSRLISSACLSRAGPDSPRVWTPVRDTSHSPASSENASSTRLRHPPFQTKLNLTERSYA